VQHFVHEPQDFPGAMDGIIEATLATRSSPEWPEAGRTRVSARLDSLGLASLRDMTITLRIGDLIARSINIYAYI
jgi:hypothetical protein